ncbi:NTP transferase domain-containing protein [Candidatus Woesearchaeota archaeon]|nr:NTP transferase domain-containing protein [Candidatus Woesearchaeota archaeon]
MQAVILAAGKSTRAYPLTLTKPKPLLKIANKTILEHNLENLGGVANEAILVVGYKKNMIKKKFRNKYKNIQIKYVEQKRQLGTGHALLIAEKYIKNDFISLYGDDIYSNEDFKNILKNKYSILVSKVDNPESFGVVVEKNGLLANLIEKPKQFISNLVNTGLYKLDKRIFSVIKNIKKSKRNEYEITDAVKQFAAKNKIKCVVSSQWLPIGYPQDLLKADGILRGDKNIIGRKSTITGKVKCSSIGDGCTINGNVENSIVMDNTTIGHGSIVRNSVIGENVRFSGKIITKNKAYSAVTGSKIKVKGLGAVIADNVRAKNVVISAGCKIYPGKKILNKHVQRDII